MAEHWQSPLGYQYLGESGYTQPCVKAITAILTSPYRPRAITAVFREMEPGEHDTDVGLVVWDWITSATIIADGFGTHHGEGGRGFATACDLIAFYQIPLQAIWLKDPQYTRIMHGYATREDLDSIRLDAQVTDASSLHPLMDKRPLWQDEPPISTPPVPYWLLEPEFLDDAQELEHAPTNAVFQVARRLEVLMREAASLPAMVTGELLLHSALTDGKPLALKGATTYEVESWLHFFQGVIGALKEPHSHREEPLQTGEAIAQILTMNLLLRKLKQDHPERFQPPRSTRQRRR